jgi:hypothetical protein
VDTNTIQLLMSDGLWLLIVVGWVLLFVTGLEADKPLSGGIPGHADASDEHHVMQEGAWGRFGEASAWVIFSAVALTLPFVLWWIFAVHGR